MTNPVLCPAGVRFDHHRHCSEINQHFHNVPPTRAGHFLLRYHQLSGIRGVVSRNPTGGQSLHGRREQINVCGTGVCDSVWSYLHFLQPCALLLLLLGHLQQLDRTALSEGHARCPHCHDRCWTRTCGCRHSILRNELECMCGTSTYCCFVHIPFRVVFTLLGWFVCVCVFWYRRVRTNSFWIGTTQSYVVAGASLVSPLPSLSLLSSRHCSLFLHQWPPVGFR